MACIFAVLGAVAPAARAQPPAAPAALAVEGFQADAPLAGLSGGAALWVRLELAAAGLAVVSPGQGAAALRGELRSRDAGVEIRLRLHHPASGEVLVGVVERAPAGSLGAGLREAAASLLERLGRTGDSVRSSMPPTLEELARAGRALGWLEAGRPADARRELARRASSLAAAVREQVDAAAGDASLSTAERARLLLARGEAQAAWGLLEPVLDGTRDARLLLAGAEVAREQHNPRWERELLARAAALDPGDADVQLALGRSLAAISRRGEARAAFERAASLRPDDPEPLEELAALAEPAQAAAHLAQAAERAEDRFELARAQRTWERVRELAPARAAEAEGRVGALHERQGDGERARAAYERAAGLDPRDARPWKGLARIRHAAGDEAGAEAAYQKALELAADDPEALRGLGEVYLESGRAAQAQPVLERALRLAPGDGRARRDLARSLHEGGASERALAVLEEADPPAPGDLRAAARIHLERGESAAGRAALERAVEIDPGDPELHEELAAARRADGDAGRAGEAARSARSLGGQESLEGFAAAGADGPSPRFDGVAFLAELVASFPGRNPQSNIAVRRVALAGVSPEAGWRVRLTRWLAPRRLDLARVEQDLARALATRFELVQAPRELPGVPLPAASRSDVALANATLETHALFVARIVRGADEEAWRSAFLGEGLEVRMLLGGDPKEVVLLANAVSLAEAGPAWLAWNVPALGGYALLLALLLLRVVRGWGSLLVRIDYQTLGPGFFTARLTRKPQQARLGKRGRRDARSRFRRRVREWSRYQRTVVHKEARFRWIPAREYYVTVSGFLEHPGTKEIIGNYLEEQRVQVHRRETAELLFDFRPTECTIEVWVSRGEEPLDGVRVAVQGRPDSLRFTRGGTTHLTVGEGRHTVLVGHADRVLARRVRIESLEPAQLAVDLADAAGVVFDGCPEAVEAFLLGAREEAAEHLERAGRAEAARTLRAEAALGKGDRSAAARLFEESQRWAEAAAVWLELGRQEQAARCFEKAGDAAGAAAAWRAAGDALRAGRAYEAAYDYESAADCYREAGERERLAALLEKEGEFHEAAACAVEDGDLDRAIENLQRIDPRHPHYIDACRMLGEIFAERGQALLAVEKLEEAIAGSSPDAVPLELRMRYAALLEEAGRLEEAVAAYEEVRRRNFHHPGAGERVEALRARLRERAPGPEPREQRYEILGELGRGGMGIVHKARDRRLARTVALKRLPESLREHPKAVELFLREARAAAALNHANIVTVHDVEKSDGSYFITMECLEGLPLHALLRRRGCFSPRDVARIGVQVCAGLQYAHSRSIVHRDIKTSNLFVTRERVVKIMDFGLAKSLEEVRRAGTVIGGTPYYMAPEQAAGEAVDHRADLYALGVTFFELATGTLPFPEGEVTYHHRHMPPPDPRERAPGIPSALAELILDLMAKRPEERPESAAAVAERLKAVLRAPV